MLNQEPISVNLPDWGVAFAESHHHPEFQMGERSDPFHKFFLVNEGRIALHLGGRPSTRVESQMIFFVPAHIGHRLEDLATASLLILCVNESFPRTLSTFQPVWSSLLTGFQQPILPSGLLTQKIEGLWRKGIHEQERAGTFTPINHQILAMDIMVNLVHATQFPRKSDPRHRVTQLEELLQSDYYENWSVERAANLVQLSRRRFSDYFKEITGKSFIERLTEIRLEKARQLMRVGEYSIAGAGFSSGFNDLSHFYRTFKKHTGLTPGEWLRQQKTKD